MTLKPSAIIFDYKKDKLVFEKHFYAQEKVASREIKQELTEC